MSLSTYEQLRACHVRRWHIVQTTREQTLAEHSFAVSVLAGSLAAKMRWSGLLHPDRKLMLLQYALSHDLIEVRTGDLPTPFKGYLQIAGGADVITKANELVDYEQASVDRMVKGTEVEMFVKIADLVEAIFFLQDNGTGMHAADVLKELLSILVNAVIHFERIWPSMDVAGAVREVCRDIGIKGLLL
jgi:5'-deoxynucleotidase